MVKATQGNMNAAHDRVYGLPNAKPFFDFYNNRFSTFLAHGMNVGARDPLKVPFTREEITANDSECRFTSTRILNNTCSSPNLPPSNFERTTGFLFLLLSKHLISVGINSCTEREFNC
jgi:hypothetical protein